MTHVTAGMTPPNPLRSLSVDALLQRLLAEGLSASLHGDGKVEVRGVTQDSRAVRPGDLFLAWRGGAHDAHDFAHAAASAGAAAVMVERLLADLAIPQIVVPDGQRAAGVLALAILGNPEADLFRVGVTGTNGKTTVAYLVRQLLGRWRPAGCLGTLGIVGPDGEIHEGMGGLTTPGPVALARALARLRDQGATAVAMEASSHALAQGRLDGLRFHAVAFTNLTQDHLDYHETMAAYRGAKARLLERVLPEGEVIVNVGDPAWSDLPEITTGVLRPVLVEGVDAAARLKARTLRPLLRATGVELGAAGASFVLAEDGAGEVRVQLPLLGHFNVENALVAAGIARAAGLSLEEIAEGLGSCTPPPGRMERTATTPCPVILDYAHTPDALARAVESLRPLVRGRLIVVFGAGGDRDRTKRPAMAQAVEGCADTIILTSDNPRTEDPEQILDDLESGLSPSTPRIRIENRRAAIARALEEAGAADLILIAGKGHERVQQVGKEALPFDERAVVAELLRERGIGAGGAAVSVASATAPAPAAEAPALIPWAWHEIREALGTTERGAVSTPPALSFPAVQRVSTDTRSIGLGDLFVALEGPHFDGHAFLHEAAGRGAAAAVVHRVPESPPTGLPLFVVEDTLTALGALARYRRDQLRARGVVVVGITGSVGKTMTRALIEAAVSSVRRVHATRANDNNLIGVPLTLLATPAGAEVVVLEMGTNQMGEIGRLTHVARPDIVLLTTVSEAHTEGLGDLEGVFVEKLSILSGTPGPRGVVVGDAPAALADRAHPLIGDVAFRVVGFSDGADPGWRGRRLEMDAEGMWRIQIPGGTFRSPVPGLHGAHNTLMALAVADLLGVPLSDAIRGLGGLALPGKRSQLVRLPGGLLLVDCYNANPQSTSAALQWLESLSVDGPKIAVLGTMAELGARSDAHHEAILQEATVLGLDGLVVLGDFIPAVRARAQGAVIGDVRVVEAAAVAEVPEALAALLAPGCAVLVKGSRSVGLEAAIPAIEALLSGEGGVR
jgi:MurE/MurF fusion protein